MRRAVLSEEEKKLFELKYKFIRKTFPKFIRQESWRYVRIKDSWRRPKGKDNKMRLHKRGFPPLPKVGYRTPRLVRGLHPSGFREVLIYNVNDIKKLVTDPSRQAIRIAASVGKRKRMAIIEYAITHNIKVLNRRL